jgi:hypothetical protein
MSQVVAEYGIYGVSGRVVLVKEIVVFRTVLRARRPQHAGNRHQNFTLIPNFNIRPREMFAAIP